MSGNILKRGTYILTSIDKNNNKFWKYEVTRNGVFTVWYGRVGGKGRQQPPKNFSTVAMAEMEAERKIREKIKKGYKPFEEHSTGLVHAEVNNINYRLQKAAIEQIETDGEQSVISDLIVKFAERNIHSILKKTTLSYDENSGLFSTPLGIVMENSIARARKLLSEIAIFIHGHHYEAGNLKYLVEAYLMIIPQKVGRKLSIQSLFPDIKALQSQNDLLNFLMNNK